MIKEEKDVIIKRAREVYDYVKKKYGVIKCDFCGKELTFEETTFYVDWIPEPQYAGSIFRCKICLEKWGVKSKKEIKEWKEEWTKEKIKCHTCEQCKKFYENHDFLCSDDICINCHGGIEEFVRCELRHGLLMITRCRFPVAYLKSEYNDWIEEASKNLTSRISKYLKKSNMRAYGK